MSHYTIFTFLVTLLTLMVLMGVVLWLDGEERDERHKDDRGIRE